MRTLLLELRPKGLVETTLGNLLEQLAQALMSRKKLNIVVKTDGDGRLPPDIQIGFYRIAQESLNNIAKHSRASNVLITLQNWNDKVKLTIEDDGRGFDLQKITPESLGIKIMRERAEAIGVSLEIKAIPGQGVKVQIGWPIQMQGDQNK
jgi:signal transduction histidine kinase